MKPVTFNQPWTTEEQVCLVLPLHARTEKIGESLCVVLNVNLLMKLADFPKDSWYVGVWFLWLKYSTYHFPVAFEASILLPICQLTFTTFQLPTINVCSRMYPQLQWNLTFFRGVMMELLDTSLTRCQRIGHLTNFVLSFQAKLEKLLQIYPQEEIESKRWEKIAAALGNRTYKQVLLQFFILL